MPEVSVRIHDEISTITISYAEWTKAFEVLGDVFKDSNLDEVIDNEYVFGLTVKQVISIFGGIPELKRLRDWMQGSRERANFLHDDNARFFVII